DVCSSDLAEKLGTDIPTRKIGEPVSAVTLDPPIWFAASGQNPAYCRVNGRMSPIDPESPDINFGVTLPSVWTHRAVQVGGGGLNGSVPSLTGGGYLGRGRSEEHTSELQSRENLVCRLLLEKKNNKIAA